MKALSLFLTVLFLLFTSLATAQVAINKSGANPDASAMLDVQDTTTGLLIPRLTLGQRNAIASPAAGLLIYQTNLVPGFYFYDGTSWKAVGNKALSINSLMDGKTGGNSVFLGLGAGVDDDGTDNQNVAAGIEALGKVTSGYWNTGFGYRALFNNVSGYSNSAFGQKALLNATGGNNTAVGIQALAFTSTGNYNSALGAYAGNFNQEGLHNVAVGANADYYNTGNCNTIIGSEAGKGSAPRYRDGSIFIGYQAGYNEMTSNKLYIENSSSSSPLIYGEFNNDLLRINGTLQIKGAYSFPVTDGSSGQVMQTDGSGVLSWTTPAAGDITAVGSMTSGAAFADASADDDWLGLGAAAGRIEFDDQATDEVNIMNANVGIGTSTPATLLDVSGGTLSVSGIATSADADAIKIGVDGEYAASIKFYDDDGEENHHFKMTFNASTDHLKFHSDDNDNILYLTNTGKIGIGTDSPKSKLQIDGGVQVGNDADVASANKAGTIRYCVSGNTSYAEMCMQTGASTWSWVVIKSNTW